MANVDAALGLRPINAGTAGTAPQMTRYEADAGGSNIFEGSILTMIAGDGLNDEVVDIWDGAADVPLVGVAAQKRLTADTTRTLLVYDDPEQRFVVQADLSGLTAASDYVGSHFNVVGATAGDTDTNQSTAELDDSTAQAAADLTHVLLGIRSSRDPENTDFTAANPNIVVKIAHSRHIYGSDSGVA